MPEECDSRSSQYALLPSRMTAEVEPTPGTPPSALYNAARALRDRGQWAQALPMFERVAEGAAGDTADIRESAEFLLAVARGATGDYGGAFDLHRLMAMGAHSYEHLALVHIRSLAAGVCRTRAALSVLAAAYPDAYGRPNVVDPGSIQTDALTARGLVELGRDAEALTLLTAADLRRTYPEFSAQCVRFIEARRVVETASAGGSREEPCLGGTFDRSCNKTAPGRASTRLPPRVIDLDEEGDAEPGPEPPGRPNP